MLHQFNILRKKGEVYHGQLWLQFETYHATFIIHDATKLHATVVCNNFASCIVDLIDINFCMSLYCVRKHKFTNQKCRHIPSGYSGDWEIWLTSIHSIQNEVVILS